MADRDTIEEIKQKLDIVSVLQEYIPTLKRAGKNYIAHCPFHNEKSPSFFVSEDIQRYKCFGCGESGDVIKFIEKFEGVDFRKALEISAQRAGVTLKTSFTKSDDKQAELRKKVFEVNLFAAQFYNYILKEHKTGEVGREYARKRKITKPLADKFLIGYAPEGYDNLRSVLLKKGYNSKDLVDWGLLVEKNGKIYDKFRKRLMFAVHNHVGDIVGFSGRVIDNADIPKYLNSSQTPVYHKSDVVYGLFQAKEAIRKEKFVILVEGNVDVPIAHKIGIENIVAPMGTALTEQQLKLIRRYTDTIYFCFDSDQAGEKALIRAFELAEKLDIKSRAINLGEYNDLDNMIQDKPELAKKVIGEAKTVVENLIVRFMKSINISTAEGKASFVTKIIESIKLISNKVEQTHYVQKVAEIVNVEEKIIWDELNKHFKTETAPTESKEIVAEKEVQPKYLNKEEYLISLLLLYPVLQDIDFDWEIISDKRLVEIYKVLIKESSLNVGIDKLDKQYQDLATRLIMENSDKFESDYEIRGSLKKQIKLLTKEHYLIKKNNIQYQIKKKEQNDEDYTELLKELDKLNKLEKEL